MKGDYWFGPDDKDRRIVYAKEFSLRAAELQANGDDTEKRITALWNLYRSTHPSAPEKPRYSSGWRPSSVNETTAHAATGSNHLQANAGDVEDSLAGEFAWWCFNNLWALEKLGLWMEHPVATVIRAKQDKKQPWCHLQRVPPASHLRCYFPDKESLALWNAQQTKVATNGNTSTAS